MSTSDGLGTGIAVLVEHYWPGVTPAAFEAAAGRIHRVAEEMAGEGVGIRFLHWTFVPHEEAAFCLFEADSQTAVEEVYARAGVRFDRVVEALHLRMDGMTT